MKKTLLFVSTILSIGAANAQFTQANEPVVGATSKMYVLDSNAANLASITGAGATWDFSNVTGYDLAATKDVVVEAGSAYAADYPTTQKAIVIPGFLTNMMQSTATERRSEGFIFDAGATAGVVKVKLNINNELTMNYPFALTNTSTDPFEGEAETGTFGVLDVTGTSTNSVDGEGTLILNSATTLTNVLRLKLVGVANSSTILGPVEITKTQYEYYHFASSNLPVFVHSTIDIIFAGTPITQTLVLSTIIPDNLLSLEENNLSFGVYPNPATESVSFSNVENSEITILDVNGKVVRTITASKAIEIVSLEGLDAGIYMVSVVNGTSKGIQKLIVE